jgi:putative ABC transport system permease protein
VYNLSNKVVPSIADNITLKTRTHNTKDLFGADSPIDKDISINGEKYTVIGVLKDKGSSIAGDSNEIIIVPITSLMRQYNTKSINSITVQANSAEESVSAKENIEKHLSDYFEDEDSYRVFSQDEMLETISEVTGMLTAMLGGIAGISLLVGGIIGAISGVAASYTISNMMGISYSVNIPVIIGSFIFSLAVGVFFGLYPANKASKLKPVDALRYE